MRRFLLLTLIALLSCGGTKQEPETPESATTEEVTAPSGERGFVVQCTDPADCVKTAANKCPAAYELKPIGESETRTETKERGAAVLLDTGSDPMAVGASKGESKSESTKKFLVECKPEAAGGIGATCKSADDCVRLRVGLREKGLGRAVCARDMNGKQVCSFPCRSEAEGVTAKLGELCTQLGRKCLATGAEDTDPPYCVTE